MRGPDHIESSPGHLPPQCRQTPRPTEKVTHLTLLTRFGMKPRTSRTRACTWTIQTQTTSWHLTSTMWEQRTTPVIFGKRVKNQKTQRNFIVFLRCPAALDFNEVLALDRFRVHHKFHISPRHLPITPSNLLKSDINLHLDSAEDEDDRIPNDPDEEDTSSVTRLNNTSEDEAVNVDGSQSNNYGQVNWWSR